MSKKRTYMEVPDLRRAIADAAASMIEGQLALMSELGEEFGSPIEERMFLGLCAAAQREQRNVDLYLLYGDRMKWSMARADSAPTCPIEGSELPMLVGARWPVDTKALHIFRQVAIGPYKADFLVEWGDFTHPDAIYRAVVECDGHDFHERTKEQAKHDRRRDRTVQGFGLPILRFTGSEIYADAVGCGAQVLAFFVDNEDREYEKFSGRGGSPP